jgi:hypothetical protein
MTRKVWVSLASLLLAITATQPAYTFDYKIHPGSLCQPENGAQAASFQRFGGYMYQTDGMANYRVTCPIIRDRVPHFNRPDELTPIDACIYFNNTSQITNLDLACQWISMDERGHQMTSPKPKFNDLGTGLVSMCWDIQPKDPNGNFQMAVDGSYSIECTLPAFIWILRYVVGEQGSTDDNGGF